MKNNLKQNLVMEKINNYFQARLLLLIKGSEPLKLSKVYDEAFNQPIKK